MKFKGMKKKYLNASNVILLRNHKGVI